MTAFTLFKTTLMSQLCMYHWSRSYCIWNWAKFCKVLYWILIPLFPGEWGFLFLILCEPVMAAWQRSWRRLERSHWEMATCASVVKPGRCAIPREPISSVMRVVLYPALSVVDTSSPYFTSFLSLASSNDVSKQTVSSASHNCFWESSHQTMSGHKSVCALWRGKW